MNHFFELEIVSHRAKTITLASLILSLVLGLSSGCSWGPCGPSFNSPLPKSKADYSASGSNQPSRPPLATTIPPDIHWGDPEFRIIAFARRYLVRHEEWDAVEFERPKRKPEGGWSVLVWKVPKTPKSALVISLDDAGQVTEVDSGS